MPAPRALPGLEPVDALAEAVARHDLHAALPLAWDAYGVRLHRYVRGQGFTAAEADDVQQEVFRRACEEWITFDGASLLGWLFTLAHYAMRTARRTAARERGRQGEPCDVAGQGPADEVLLSTSRLDVALGGLDPLDRVIVGCLAESARTSEIQAAILQASGLALNEAQIRKRVQRLRALLADRIGLR